jgi:serpin B
MILDLELAAADAAFGGDLYRKLAGTANLVFSPASVAQALRMALAGARGDTATELRWVLHLPELHDAAAPQDLLASIPASGDLVLRSVNTAWIDSELPVRPEFLATAGRVRPADFRHAAQAARQAINADVAEQTAGKIGDLLAPGMLGERTRLVLVNALYLKARWEHQFSAGQTSRAPFYPQYPGQSGAVRVDMMRILSEFAYQRGDGYQSVLLPYAGGPLAMAVVLPDEPLTQFNARLGRIGGLTGVLGALLAQDERVPVNLRMPKFKVTEGFRLRDTLQSLGLTLSFSGHADFSGITESSRLEISEVVHKAYIDVTEEGTEGAAATAVIMHSGAMVRPSRREPVVFTADRPFLFAVVETTTGLPLFLGQFTRPEKTVPLEGSAARRQCR